MIKFSKKTKAELSIIVLILIVISFIYYYTNFISNQGNDIKAITIPELEKVFSALYLGNNQLIIAGIGGNPSHGEAFVVNLNNMMNYIQLKLGRFFQNGSIYTIGYNGTTLMFGGDNYIGGNLHTCLVADNGGSLHNLSYKLGSDNSLGQIWSVTWYNGYWLIGGNTFIYLSNGEGVLLPMLVKEFSNGSTVNLSPNLPSYFTPAGGGFVDSIYDLSPSSRGVGIAGGNTFNATFAVYNGTFQSFSVNGYDEGFFVSSTFSPQGWIVAGELYESNHFSPYVVLFHNGSSNNVTLPYHVGFATSVIYTNGTYVLSLKVPFASSSGLKYGTIILYGKLLQQLKVLYKNGNQVIEDMSVSGNYITAVGYTNDTTVEGLILKIHI
ncbi:hypothetical protein [Sulfuracidifex metallicus]|uniref:hypothetical protein n=1 Tax=Sulfuracidifex metallicus TaxID=47303 RepID=UPI0022750D86|nr:hypothetical protein [Sulfuracidifex metallicus]MCY0850341.1 hypothetical protein [Sulfuracidifex metallicus]